MKPHKPPTNLASPQLAAIVEYSEDAIIGCDLNSIVTSWNKAAEKFYGFTSDEMVGSSIVPLIPPDRRDEEDRILEKIKAGENLDHYETKRITKAGRTIDVSMTASPIKDADGMPFGVSRISRDITRQKRAEEEARRTRDQLHHLLEHSPVVTFQLRIEKQGIVPVVVSDNIQQMLGFTVAEAGGYQWLVEQLHPDDRERVVATIGEKLNHDGYLMDYRLRHKDGTYRWLEDRTRIVKNASGEPMEIVGVWTDITERKRAEEILRGASSTVAERRRRRALIEIFLVFGLSVLVFGVGIFTDCFDPIFRYLADSNAGMDNHADDLTATMVFFCFALLIFCYRRWWEDQKEVVSQTQVAESLRLLHGELETKVQERTVELVKANDILQREITERKRAEETIQQFPEIIESTDDAIISTSMDGTITTWNPAAEKMFGYSATEIIGRAVQILVPLNRPEENLDILARIERNERIHHFETVRLRKDGRPLDVSITISAIRGDEGNNRGISHIVRDITEQKRAEEQIAEQATFLNKARDAILARDLDGKVQFWNQGAERLYGWTSEEVVGRNVGDFLYAIPQKFTEVNGLTIRQGEWQGELQHLTKSGREITIEARWTLIRDNEGHPKSVLAINTDITEKKRIESQFMRAQRMESIGTLAGGVAHDLNNILAPIMMSIDMLKDLSERPEALAILDTIEASAKRGADIVGQVLSFARGMEGDRVEIQPKHLLKEVQNIIKDTFPKDIRIQVSFPKDSWTILGDHTQVQQILLNLCVNARDAMPNGGTLTINIENCVLDKQYAAMHIQAKPGRYVNINVTDSGTGIPPEILDKIFEPFFTTKPLNKGTGLGLSTVLAIVESHDGLVDVYSEPGKGTTFKVYLPATETSSAAHNEQVEEANLPRGHGETILLIDDEISILTITGQTLQTYGYRVLTASDGAEGVAAYAQHKNDIAIILTDMMMPVMDGTSTIRAVKRMNPAVKILAASGLKANGEAAEASGAGPDRFLTKPYTAGTLLKALREVLDETKP